MLELGDVVELGEEKFEVTQVPNRTVFPCRICELRDCGINKDFIALKYQHKAVSCYQLIGDKSYLKKVE